MHSEFLRFLAACVHSELCDDVCMHARIRTVKPSTTSSMHFMIELFPLTISGSASDSLSNKSILVSVAGITSLLTAFTLPEAGTQVSLRT